MRSIHPCKSTGAVASRGDPAWEGRGWAHQGELRGLAHLGSQLGQDLLPLIAAASTVAKRAARFTPRSAAGGKEARASLASAAGQVLTG